MTSESKTLAVKPSEKFSYNSCISNLLYFLSGIVPMLPSGLMGQSWVADQQYKAMGILVLLVLSIHQALGGYVRVEYYAESHAEDLTCP